MPIMEFKCASCGHRFEELLPNADTNGVVCPSCSGSSVEKQFSVFGVSVRGGSSPAPRDMGGGGCCGGACGCGSN